MKKTKTDETPRKDSASIDCDTRVLFALRRIIRAVDIHSRMLALEHNITGPQLACLLAVVEKESITATEIADRISLSASTVIGIIDRLEAKGFVERRRDAKDRRVIHIFATGEGKEIAEKMPYPLRQPLNNALSRMSKKEQTMIADALDLLVVHMGADEICADPILEIGAISKKVE